MYRPQFEVTAVWFDGGSDDTDDAVFWVSAPNIEEVEAAVLGTGATVLNLDLDDEEDMDFVLPEDADHLREAVTHLQPDGISEAPRLNLHFTNMET